MTGERLLPCPCCGSEAVENPHLSTVRCSWCGLTGDVDMWGVRSLPAALDRVIAEVEAMPVTPDALVQACKPSSAYETYQEHLLKLLRALRAEHSAGEGEDG